MFDVGFAELFLLALIGLIVLGPERLPAVARTIGGFVSKARASWVSLRNTIEAELAEADIAAPLKEASEEFKRIGKDLSSSMPDLSDIPGFTEEDHKPKAQQPDKEPATDSQEKLFSEKPQVEIQPVEKAPVVKPPKDNPSEKTNTGDTDNGKDSHA